MYLVKEMKARTKNSCTVPWVRDDKSVCITKEDMNSSYWEHYTRITNQKTDCPNPCKFLAVSAGGQNREHLNNNKSQVSITHLTIVSQPKQNLT